MTPCPNHIKLWGQILSPCEEIVKVFDLRSDNYSLAKFMVLLNISNIKDIVLSVVGNTKVNKTWHLCTNFWSCSKADVKNKWLQLVLSIYFVPGPVLSVLSAFWVFHSWFFYLYEVEITDFFLKMEKLEVQRGHLICPKFSQLVCVRVMISLRLVIPKPEILTFVHCKPLLLYKEKTMMMKNKCCEHLEGGGLCR